MARELALGAFAGKTDAALGATAREDRATGLGARAGEETKLAHTALLRGLERSFHGRDKSWEGEPTRRGGYDKRNLTTSSISPSRL